MIGLYEVHGWSTGLQQAAALAIHRRLVGMGLRVSTYLDKGKLVLVVISPGWWDWGLGLFHWLRARKVRAVVLGVHQELKSRFFDVRIKVCRIETARRVRKELRSSWNS